MTLLNYSFEGGTVGANLAPGQTGSGDPLGAVTPTAGSTLTYDTTQFSHGAKSCKITPVSGGQARMDYRGLATSSLAARAYYYLTALPGVDTTLMQFADSTDARRLSIRIDSGNKLHLDDANGIGGTGTRWIAAATFPLNQWVRVELYAVPGADATSGTVKVAYYLGDSTAPIEAVSSSAAANAGTTALDRAIVGKVNTSTYATPFWVDDFAATTAATDFIGPWTAPAQSSVRPATVTSNAGGWVNQGGAATLQAALADESDVTYAETPALTSGQSASFTTAFTPLSAGDVTVKVRHQASAASPTISRLYELLQGSTVIASSTANPLPVAWTDYAFTTTPTQTAAITDRTALAVRVTDTSA